MKKPTQAQALMSMPSEEGEASPDYASDMCTCPKCGYEGPKEEFMPEGMDMDMMGDEYGEA